MQTQNDAGIEESITEKKDELGLAGRWERVQCAKGGKSVYLQKETTAAEISKNHEIYLSSNANSKKNGKLCDNP